MRVYDLIWKKREGLEMTPEEIAFLIAGFVKGEIPDYQMSAWCMAVFFRGMTFAECTWLTLEMAKSGGTVDLTEIPGIKIDKHSTGGVGDKTSLVLLPLVAAAGIPVAKMSGRALGHTGGTIDKLESIPGFRTNLSKQNFLEQVSKIGIGLIGQTGDLVPADKRLYALRDLTATVESIPLIASSIVSKKLAAGADAVILDVKYGDGAFMQKYEDAHLLAETMVEIGTRAGRRFHAILSDMNQPLGLAIGNSLEVAEAIHTLRGEGPTDLTELCLTLGGYMLWMSKKAATPKAGELICEELLRTGQGLAKLRQLIDAQGGKAEVTEDLSLLPKASVKLPVRAIRAGWIQKLNCRALGNIAMKLGAGRDRLEDVIRPEVGIQLQAKIGDRLHPEDLLAVVHAHTEAEARIAATEILSCYTFSEQPVEKGELIREII